MKKKYLKSIKVYTILFFSIVLACPAILLAEEKLSYRVISGIIYDEESKKEVSNATLHARGSNISTMTNAEGFFALKVGDTVNTSKVEISHLGYDNKTISIEKGDQQNLKIYLSPHSKQLKEVIVEWKDPLEIVKEAILRIEKNNSTSPNILRGFYRETAKKRDTYITIAEAVVDVYKSSYTKDLFEDAIQVLKGRTLLSPKISDTIAVKAQGGPNIAKYLDIAKNKDIMLDLETIDYYEFTLDGVTSINDKTHYIISFKPQVKVSYALYYGKLYINKTDLTLSRAELHLMVDDKEKAIQAVLIKKPSKMRFQVNSLSSTITYQQQNGKSYLSYINNEIKFKCNWKKIFYIFAPTYTINSEIVMTDRIEDNVKKLALKDVFGDKQTLSDKIEHFYDPNFWQAYNIIEPTESLENAVNKLKKANN